MRALLPLQLAAATLLHAQEKIRELFPEKPAGYLTDVAGVVDERSAKAITDKVQRLRDATGAEIAVVTLPTIREYATGDVALAIGRAWGVGAAADVGDQRRNAGVVLLLVPRTRDAPGHVFIATGRGVEGMVTDAAAGRIRDLMRPQLAAGEYGPGLRTGVDALAGLIARGFGVTDSTLTDAGRAVYRSGAEPNGTSLLTIILIVAIAVVFISRIAMSAARAGGYGGRRRPGPRIFWGGPGGWGGGSGGFGGGFGGFGGGSGGGFGGFGGGGGFSGGGAGGTSDVIEPFLAGADQVLGKSYSAVLSGSAVRGDHLAGRSDYNLLVVADRLDGAALRGLGPAFAPFAERGLQPPLVISQAEWARAADVFPIEIADMRTAYRVVRGSDPLLGLVVKHADLRRALESEFRGKLLQLRTAYSLYHADGERLAAVVGHTIGSIRVLLRATLVLDGKTVPAADAGLVTDIAGLLSVEGGALAELLQHRRHVGWRAEASLFEAYLGIVEAATRFIDHHHAGVH